ncbi:hypothetical protein [Sphingomonas sp. BK235]|uniref:hypothetical protein n=1 Tax=Sphingomonas sp. BK235 TaxID=2512131 RepID=UPI00104E0EC8|nr:hypothetical protein [Sphingomonas sp. BK235]
MTRESLTSRFLRTLRRSSDDDRTKSPSAAEIGLATEAFRQILSAAKALLVYYNLDRAAGDQFHLNLGHGLSQRYAEEERTDAEYQVMAQALRFHCSAAAAHQFYEAARLLNKPLPYTMPTAATFKDNGVAPLVPTIDFYGLARDQAHLGSLERESGPFTGAAGDLWNAGMDGLPESASIVVRSREQLWALLAGDQPRKVLRLTGG